MNALPLFERASAFGLAALIVALAAQTVLDGRVPASWRVWLWRVALLQSALALLPLAPLSLAVLPPSPAEPVAAPVAVPEKAAPPLPVPALSGPVIPSATDAPSPNAPSISSRVAPLPEVAPAPAVAPRAKKIEVQTPPVDLRPFVLAFYALGLGVQLVALARPFRRVRRLLRACTPVQDARTGLQLREIARRMGVSGLPRLLESEGGAPFLVGIFAPAIVLPGALLAPENRDLEAVLSHELAHLKRRDLVWNALLWPVGALFWFHPLVWVARRFLLLETESACDEMVLGSTRISPRSYGALLLNTMNTYQTPLTAGVADGSGALKTRLVRLNRAPKRPRRVFKIAFVAALCGAGAASVPLRLVARAQNAAPVAAPVPHPATAASPVAGVVLDKEGNPVVGATVYALKLHSQMPLETVTSTAKGAFAFSPKVQDHFKIELFADAGKKSFAHLETYQSQRRHLPLVLAALPATQATLRLTDVHDHAVEGLSVTLWHLETPANSWVEIPFPLLKTMGRVESDEHGLATFPRLPQGMTAHFSIGNRMGRSELGGATNAKGREFAPLSSQKDIVDLNRPVVLRNIRLLEPMKLQGRVTLPGGLPAKGVSINAFCLDEMQPGSGKRNPDWPVWSYQMFCDAKGRYSFAGLRPGRYKIGAYPQPPMDARYASTSATHSFASGSHRFDLALSPGALVQGVVVSKASGKPLAGCPVYVSNARNDFQVAPTDAHGAFHFRVVGGAQRLSAWRDYSQYGSPGAALKAQFSTSFSIQKGQKREFKIEMPVARVVKPVKGTVVGPDGRPVARAGVQVRVLGKSDGSLVHSITCDARGHFALPSAQFTSPIRLWADEGELATPRSTIAVPGDDVTLRLEKAHTTTVQGQVVDLKTQRPLAGASVVLNQDLGDLTFPAFSTRTGKDGKFRFVVNSSAVFTLQARRNDHAEQNVSVGDIKGVGVSKFIVSLPSVTARVSGRVIRADGTPARGFHVNSFSTEALTQRDGSFSLGLLFKGKAGLFVKDPGLFASQSWGPVLVQGGRKDVLIRLTDAILSENLDKDSPLREKLKQQQKVLVGQLAPELETKSWIGTPTPLSTLPGQVVLLNFGSFSGPSQMIDDFARSYSSRGVRVIGVQRSRSFVGSPFKLGGERFPQPTNKNLSFPVANDAPLEPPGAAWWIAGRSAAFYKGARYVVIGRDGRIVYAGDQLDRAITFADSASK